MCVAVIQKVVRVSRDSAYMSDGRCIRLGDMKKVHPGDYLEVYADIAVSKVSKKDAHLINERGYV